MEKLLNLSKQIRDWPGDLESFLIANDWTFRELVEYMEHAGRNWIKVEDEIYHTTRNSYRLIHFDESEGEYVFFGSYKTLKRARLAKALFEKSGWDYELLNEIRKMVCNYRKCQEAYIYTQGNGYAIRKRVGNKTSYFGYYKTLNETIEERDKLIANNWIQEANL